jgi:Bacterial Ig-like domain (group 1)
VTANRRSIADRICALRMDSGRALTMVIATLVMGASTCVLATAAQAAEPLSPYQTFSGEHLALSVDALGTNNEAGGPIRVEKKDAGETVRAAYLFGAEVPGAAEPANGDVTLAGESVDWETGRTIQSSFGSWSAVANVTSIVKPIVDPASPGLISITVAEGVKTLAYDGEILAVVLEDPAVKEQRSITLLYGTENTAGDTFHVKLAEPVNKSNPNFALNLGLGISYGYQTALETTQYSIVKVDEKLLTSSAGGADDCVEKYSATPNWENCPNGTLITAGGIGDSLEDPPNPEATPATCENAAHEKAPRCDDELYSLLPFVNNGETELTFNTSNPSNNDNILFGALEVRGGTAVVGEGITLSPSSGTNKTGEGHTVTATVQTEKGEPVVGTDVHFEVVSGPNAGKTGEVKTEASGKAQFTYASAKTGTDHIAASFVNAKGETQTSNEVAETWEESTTEEGPSVDGIASAQHQKSATAKLTTKESGDLLLAFVGADGPYPNGAPQTTVVSGGGLTWTLVGRTNAALGDAEVWSARATGPLTEAQITAKANVVSPGSPAGQGYDVALTVAGFKNATGTGAVSTSSSKKGAPTGTLKTTGAKSWVWASGDDWLASVKRSPGPAQKVWHEGFDAVGDTYWVQSTEAVTKAAGTSVTINDTAPANDPFNLVLVEVL